MNEMRKTKVFSNENHSNIMCLESKEINNNQIELLRKNCQQGRYSNCKNEKFVRYYSYEGMAMLELLFFVRSHLIFWVTYYNFIRFSCVCKILMILILPGFSPKLQMTTLASSLISDIYNSVEFCKQMPQSFQQISFGTNRGGLQQGPNILIPVVLECQIVC